MDFKVIFQETFLEDLEEIVRRISVQDQSAAIRFGETVVHMGESLAFFPERHPRLRQRPSVRRYIVSKHFKIFYRVHQDSKVVEILRCWDGRRKADPKF